jgi:hypothetical protein
MTEACMNGLNHGGTANTPGGFILASGGRVYKARMVFNAKTQRREGAKLLLYMPPAAEQLGFIDL